MSFHKRYTAAENDRRNLARAHDYIDEAGLPEDSQAVAWAHRFIETFSAPGTRIAYALGIRDFFTWCHARSLEPFEAGMVDAAAFEASMAHYAAATRKGRCGAVRSFFRSAVENEITRRNPFILTRLSAAPETPTPAVTPEIIARVLEAIAVRDPVRLIDQRDYTLVVVASRLGPRRIELARLRWQDLVDSERGPQLRLHRKGGSVQLLSVPDDVLRVLNQWRAILERCTTRRLRAEEPIFPALGLWSRPPRAFRRHGLEPLCPEAITTLVRNRFADVGIVGKRYAAHALRASAATIAWENGAGIDDIQLMLGHSSPATTWRYIRRIWRPSAAETWSVEGASIPGAAGSDAARIEVAA